MMTPLVELLQRYGGTGTTDLTLYQQHNIITPWMDTLFGFNDNSGLNNIFATAKSNLDKAHIIKGLIDTNIGGGILYNNNTYGATVEYSPLDGSLKIGINDGALTTGTNLTYQAGWFISPTVGEIKQAITQINPAAGTPVISVVAGKDVGAAHLDGQPYEIFQGASQFNALEMANQDATPHDGIEIYIYDNTQGPRTALVAAPGTFVRNYWVTSQYLGQFNALERMGLSNLNGYLVWGNNPGDVLPKIDPDQLMIPCMVYTQLAGITKGGGTVKAHALNKLVHQVYSSGVPINTYRNGGDLTTQLTIAQRLITAGYRGVIGIGIILHTLDKAAGRTNLPRPRINLTLVGGGVFNVPIDTVLNSIRDAIQEYNNYDCDIVIHGYALQSAQQIANYFNTQIVPFGTTIQHVQQVQPTVQQIQPTVQQVQPTLQPTVQQVQPAVQQVQQIQPTVQQVQPTLQPTVQQVQPTVQQRVQPTVQQIQPTVQQVPVTQVQVKQGTQSLPQVPIPRAQVPVTQQIQQGQQIQQIQQGPVTRVPVTQQGQQIQQIQQGPVTRVPVTQQGQQGQQIQQIQQGPVTRVPVTQQGQQGQQDYVILVGSQQGLKAYPLRTYQQDMLRRAQMLNEGQQQEYKVGEGTQAIRATLFAIRGETGKEIGFLTEGGETRYFINYRNNPKIGQIQKNTDGSWTIYDKNGQLITGWP